MNTYSIDVTHVSKPGTGKHPKTTSLCRLSGQHVHWQRSGSTEPATDLGSPGQPQMTRR